MACLLTVESPFCCSHELEEGPRLHVGPHFHSRLITEWELHILISELSLNLLLKVDPGSL